MEMTSKDKDLTKDDLGLDVESTEKLLSPSTNPEKPPVGSDASSSKITIAVALEFIACFSGLQISYLIWGIMQELIMNTQYSPTPLVPNGMFPSATFCVFSNRFLAIIVAALCCWRIHGTVQSSAPLIYFTPCAISNTISSWSQYQVLQFVSFSLQTLFKATKVIPVMLMGKLLKGTNYSTVEYVEALFITAGVTVFSMAKGNQHGGETTTQIFGFVLLCSYVLSDSFTSQWQSRIYRDYGKIDHYHMMFGVNVSSIIITMFAMVVSGEIPAVIEFFSVNPAAFWYNVMTAITSTTGQIAIFYTIKRFGPITFTIIMTTRQMLSIVLSTILFGHHISMLAVLGAFIVFLAVFHSIHRQMEDKKNKDPKGAPKDAKACKGQPTQ